MSSEPPVGLPIVTPVIGDVLFWHTDTSTLWEKLKHFADWRIQADQGRMTESRTLRLQPG